MANVSGGSSIFTIPVELNKNNTIIGMTTRMSVAHEISYNIFISLAAAKKGGSTSSSTGFVKADGTISTISTDNSKLQQTDNRIIRTNLLVRKFYVFFKTNDFWHFLRLCFTCLHLCI